MLRRVLRRLGSTNRYYDGSGRALDGASPPSDLHLPAISNRAYPRRGEHWQVAVAEAPTPHKGNVIVSGAGVVGLTVATLFALRGWHTTVVERARACGGVPPVLTSRDAVWAAMDAHKDAAAAAASCGSSDHDVATCAAAERAVPTPAATELPYALITRRAADVFAAAGVHVTSLRACGVVVDGVLDHPGSYHSLLTRGLVEQHAFAVRMLAVDLHKLRCLLEQHATGATATTTTTALASATSAQDAATPVATVARHNLRVFYEHVIEAVYPLRQELVVVDCAARRRHNDNNKSNSDNSKSNVNKERDDDDELVSASTRPRRLPTSLTLSERQWRQRYADDAVSYDLLVCAEGATSRLRSLLDVEGFVADADFVTRWFVLRTRALCHRHVHRWLHRAAPAAWPWPCARHTRTTHDGSTDEHDDACVTSAAAAVSMCCAFPRVEDATLFAVMAYMPAAQLRGLDDRAFLHTYLPDVARCDAAATLCSFALPSTPAPTVFCEELYNTVGLPSAALVGDAAHHCHPFWMQGLAVALEDGAHLLNVMDAYSRDCYDAVQQYSTERGVSADALRQLTERCLYYERHKHTNVLLRACNAYRHLMHRCVPTHMRRYSDGRPVNHYARSLEDMLNGRGYTSYTFAEEQQVRHARYSVFARLYT